MNIDTLLQLAKTPKKFKDEFYFLGYISNNSLILDFINKPGYLLKLANEWSAYSFRNKNENFMADEEFSKILEEMLLVLTPSEREKYLRNEMSKVEDDMDKKYHKEQTPLVMVLLKNRFPKTINMMVKHGYELSPVEIKFALYKGMEKDMYMSFNQDVVLSESEAGEMIEKAIAKSGDVNGVLSRILSSENNKKSLFSYLETQRKRDIKMDYYYFRENNDYRSLENENVSMLYKQIAKGKVEFVTLLLQAGFELNMKEFALSFSCLVNNLDLKKQKEFIDLLQEYPLEYKKEFFKNVLTFVNGKFVYKATPVFAQLHDFLEEVIPALNEREIFAMKSVKISETGYIVFQYADKKQKAQFSELWEIAEHELDVKVPLAMIASSFKYKDYTESLQKSFERTVNKICDNDDSLAINYLTKLMEENMSDDVYSYFLQIKSIREKSSLQRAEILPETNTLNRTKNRI